MEIGNFDNYTFRDTKCAGYSTLSKKYFLSLIRMEYTKVYLRHSTYKNVRVITLRTPVLLKLLWRDQ